MLILKAFFLLLAVFIVMPLIFFVLLLFLGRWFLCTVHPASPLVLAIQQHKRK